MKYIGFKEPKNHWSIEDKHSNLRSTDHVTMPIYKSVSIDSLIVKVCALYKKSIVQVTGWVLLPELVPVSLSGARISCGLQLAWSQDEMTLLAGGDTRVTLATTEYLLVLQTEDCKAHDIFSLSSHSLEL